LSRAFCPSTFVIKINTMEMIHIIFLIFFGGAIITYFAGKVSKVLQDILFLISVLVPAYLFFAYVSMGKDVSLGKRCESDSWWNLAYLGCQPL